MVRGVDGNQRCSLIGEKSSGYYKVCFLSCGWAFTYQWNNSGRFRCWVVGEWIGKTSFNLSLSLSALLSLSTLLSLSNLHLLLSLTLPCLLHMKLTIQFAFLRLTHMNVKACRFEFRLIIIQIWKEWVKISRKNQIYIAKLVSNYIIFKNIVKDYWE